MTSKQSPLKIVLFALVTLAIAPIYMVATSPTRLQNHANVYGKVEGPKAMVADKVELSLSYPFKDRDLCHEVINPDKDGSFAFCPVNGAADYLVTARYEGYITQVQLIDLSAGDKKISIKMKKK